MHAHQFLDQQAEQTRTAHAPPPRRRLGAKGVLLVVFVVLCLALGGLLVFAAGKIGHGLSVAKVSAAAAQTAMKDGDFTDAAAALGEAKAALYEAQSGVRLVGFLRFAPWVGTQLRGLSYTLDAGIATLDALERAVAIVVDVRTTTQEAQALLGVTDSGEVPYGELASSARVALLDALHDAHPDLLTMQVKLAIAQEDLAQLRALNVAPVLLAAVAPFETMLEPLAEAVDLLAPFAAVVPELAGLGADRQFLLLFANNTELRPSGGFLGVYGLSIVRDGEVIVMTTDDTYNVDVYVAGDGYFVAPPTPLTAYLGTPKWFFRDSNWSPDFPTATKDGVQLFRQEIAYAGQPVPEVHGVLMFTPTFIGRLLDLVGPITVDGQTFTSENIADKLEYQVEVGYVEAGIPLHQRKDVVARMADTLVDRVLAMPSSRWPELFAVLTKGFGAKELALWSADEDVQATYADAGWAGEAAQGSADDVLMVVDANLAALKTDPVVDRTIAYAVRPTSAGYEATVTITYDHNGSFDWKTTRYRTYTRVYVPLGSTLVSSEGSLANDKLQSPSGAEGTVTTADELGMTGFGAFTSVEPGKTQQLSFTYMLPSSVGEAIDAGVYELRVIKQLGAASHDLALDLDFGASVTYATPPEDEDEWGDERYYRETALDGDKEFTVRIE